ncbi:MAG: hypothetical protein GTO03_11660 [Planctomycetales bacterium]|nr:hypothetical protein [Planctomycetales bacterium]
MYRWMISLLVVCLILTASAAAVANDYLVGGMFSTPAVTHYRVAAAPVVAPTPVTVYSPVVAAPVAPVTCASPIPVTVYSPVVAPVHVLAARPVVAAPPVLVGRPVVTRSKFYVPGQPIRNVFRWLGPGVPTGVAVVP